MHGSGRLYPDVVLFFPNKVVIVEVKLKSSVFLWYQLEQLYAPLARVAWPGRPICELGIVRTLLLPIPDVPSQPNRAETPDLATPSGYWVCEYRTELRQ